MSDYTLEAVLAREEIRSLGKGFAARVQETYLAAYAAYEDRVPYSHAKLPGIVGVQVYQLNKEMVAYAAAVQEAERRRAENLK